MPTYGEAMSDKRLTYNERREEIKTLIENIGLWNINISQLSRKYDVSRNTIYKDLKAITKHIPKEELEHIDFALHKAFRKSISEAQAILIKKESTTQDKLRAMQVIATLSNSYTDMLERFGLKEKIPDRLETMNMSVGLTMDQLKGVYVKWKEEYQ